MTGLRRLTGLIICSGLMWAAPAAADPISELNVIASDTIFAGGRPAGAAPMLDFAMVHAAIHDAVQVYEKRFRPYEFHIWWRPRGSRVAAAAAAARDVLVNRFPAQEAVIQTKYLLFLTNHGLTPADEGTDVGERAASAIIARRANDGSYPTPPPPPDLGGTGAGQWRPTLPLFAPFSAPWLGKVEPFTKDFSAQFRARRPPALTSREYARDYNEVKAKGGAVGHTRTPDQTQIAHFYAGNTIALFQGMIRGLIGACEMGSRQRDVRASTGSVTAPGCSPWPTWRVPTLASQPGTVRSATTSGDRSRRFSRCCRRTTTKTRGRRPMRHGCR